MQFTAIDVETANADMNSICQIGIARFANGQLVEEQSNLIDYSRLKAFLNRSWLIILALWLFSAGPALANWGYIDKSGKVVIKPHFNQAGNFHEGLAPVQVIDSGKPAFGRRRSDSWTFIDRTGREICPPKFNYAGPFSEGLAAIELGHNDSLGAGCLVFEGRGKLGFIDRSSKIVIQPSLRAHLYYEEHNYNVFGNGLAPAKTKVESLYGFINRSGSFAIPEQFDGVKPFAEGVAPVSDLKAHHWGYIRSDGNYVIPPRFGEAEPFNNGLAVVTDDDYHTSVIDHHGNVVFTKPDYDIKGYSENAIVARIKSGVIFVDTTGHQSIATIFEDAKPFSDGMAAVMLDGSWGFVNHAGKLVIPCRFDDVSQFSSGLAAVSFGEAPTFGKPDKIAKVECYKHELREAILVQSKPIESTKTLRVLLRLMIDHDGMLQDAQVLCGSGNEQYDKNIYTAANRAKFPKPPSWITPEWIDFRIKIENTPSKQHVD